MKHYQIGAEAFIGWIRIARPGSVLGPQQYYLAQSEPKYVMDSPIKGSFKSGDGNYANLEMSPADR
jgi:hypothetical protein